MGTGSWHPFGCSVIGASHEKNGLPLQDAFYCRPSNSNEFDDYPAVVAVSDGHGSSKHCRSNIGAEFAVLSAGSIATNDFKLSSDMPEDNIEGIIKLFKAKLLSHWRERVDEHYNANNFTDEELAYLNANCSEKDEKEVLENHRIAYGCTLMCVIAYNDVVLVLQLGDGDILGLYSGGARMIIEPNDANFGGATLSLCKITDISDIQHVLLYEKELPVMFSLMTDGIRNSYNDLDDNSMKAFFNISAVIKSELDKAGGSVEDNAKLVKAKLETFLSTITHNGSGDDVTIGVIYRI